MLLLQYVEVANMRHTNASYDTSERSVPQSISALWDATNKQQEVSEEHMYSLHGTNS